MGFSCDNCPSTVWFDHDGGRWKHSRTPPTRCKKPEPRHPRDRG